MLSSLAGSSKSMRRAWEATAKTGIGISGLGQRPEVRKAIVVGAVRRKGNVVARIIENIKGSTLTAFVNEAVSHKFSLLCTDDWPGYARLAEQGYPHGAVDHHARQYVYGAVHTQTGVIEVVEPRGRFRSPAPGSRLPVLARFSFAAEGLAASVRPFKLTAASETRNTCAYCSVARGIVIYGLGDRAKNAVSDIIHIEGDPDHPVNRGTLCPKGSALTSRSTTS
jgi:ISXO2-like transposase domain/Molybdopterin oxidoreductase Fe4S4 domain